MLTKWREQVTDDEEEVAFEILGKFGIDVCRQGDFMPVSNLD